MCLIAPPSCGARTAMILASSQAKSEEYQVAVAALTSAIALRHCAEENDPRLNGQPLFVGADAS
jgi:hypothetical protein